MGVMGKVSGSVGWDGPGRALSSPARSHLAPGSPLPLNSMETNGPPPGGGGRKISSLGRFRTRGAALLVPACRDGGGLFQVSDDDNARSAGFVTAGTEGVNWQSLRPQCANSGRLSAAGRTGHVRPKAPSSSISVQLLVYRDDKLIRPKRRNQPITLRCGVGGIVAESPLLVSIRIPTHFRCIRRITH